MAKYYWSLYGNIYDLLGIKKFSQILNKNTSPYFHSASNLTVFFFLRAVVNIPIQTLIIPPRLLFRKMIISQLEHGPSVRERVEKNKHCSTPT